MPSRDSRPERVLAACAAAAVCLFTAGPAVADAPGALMSVAESNSSTASASYEAGALGSLREHLRATGTEEPSKTAASTVPSKENAKTVSDLPEPESGPRASADAPTGGGASSLSTALPSGAASVLGMGESFTPQLSTGIATFGLPLRLPMARGGIQPRLDLSYTSAGGFGVAGKGWSIGASSISRQMDRGMPRYDDRADWYPEQDRFALVGSELIPICTVHGGTCAGAPGEVMPGWADGWQYFRSRVESGFLRVFWSKDHRSWRVQSRDGTNFEYGVPLDGSGYTNGLEANPEKPAEVYRWYLVRQYDAMGNIHNQANPRPVNVATFRYLKDGGASYLSDIYDTTPVSDPTTANLSVYAHHARLTYERRPDKVESYRTGWRMDSSLRLVSVDVTSKPFAGAPNAARTMVRRYLLEYAAGLHESLLASVQMEGRCDNTVAESASEDLPATSCPRMPKVEFDYQRVSGPGAPLTDSSGMAFERFSEKVQDLANSPPRSLDDPLTGLMDVNSDGLPDVVVTAPALFNGGFGVYANGLDSTGNMGFGAARTMEVVAAGQVDAGALLLNSSVVSVLDVEGFGLPNLVHMPQAKTYSVFSERFESGAWRFRGRQVQTAHDQDVKIDFTKDARNIRVMDVNGDGLVDVVYSSPTEYQTFLSLGRYPGGADQFGHATRTSATTADISNDPITSCAPWSATPARFSDADVHVADMNGDGLPDIVRLRAGQVFYWPGRGNGFWGTGARDDCPGGNFATKRHIEMATPPQFGTTDPGSLLLGDVSGDGFADVVEIRNDDIDVYLNDNGRGWTSRYTLRHTPTRPNGSSYVQVVDIDGSGTPDILWGHAREYRYIDLMGGAVPHLLVTSRNGLGGTTDLEYASSASLMRAAAAAGKAWTQPLAPTVTPVLVRSTARDHLDKVGMPAGTYVTEYSYRDPVFEGRQREFRGFRQTEVRAPGDPTSPTSTQRTTFLLGECPKEANGTSSDVCNPSTLWQDNWAEALKGLPVLTETFDDNGVFLSTEHQKYELRQLYSGLDGRRVVVPYPVAKESFVYDASSFDRVPTPQPMDDVLFKLPGVVATRPPRQVVKQAQAGTAHVRTQSAYDGFGNMLQSIREGCLDGCPNGVDEVITSTSIYDRPPNDASGWAFREIQSYVTGSIQTARRNEISHTYNADGKLVDTLAMLSGTLPLSRFQTPAGPAVAPAPANASGGATAPVQILLSHNGYDPTFGRLTSTTGPNGRCGSTDSDPLYGQVTIASRTFAGTVGANGCGTKELVTRVTGYDRGLEVTTDSVDANNQPTHVDYDGFGRVRQLTGPNPQSPGSLAAYPSFTASYLLTTDPVGSPYSIIVSRTQDGTSMNSGVYGESWVFEDGLGRKLVTLSPADRAAGDPGDYVVSGAVFRNKKGGTNRSYAPWFLSGTYSGFRLSDPPPSVYKAEDYDAFSRGIVTYGWDHHVENSTKLHAVSQDVYDAADLGSRAGTQLTLVSDGHGRAVQRIERILVGTVLEQRLALNDYLPTGQLRKVTRRKAGATDVVRWARYDSIGRMVLNVEPNTSTGFDPDPNAALTGIKAIRYAYNDAGDIVGTSDARGCGVNYFYDAGGRVLAADRSPCLPTPIQAAYTAPNLTTGDGTEAFYRYDTPDPDNATIKDAAQTPLGVDTTLLTGRLVSVSGLGSKNVFKYDALGRKTGTAVRVVKAGTPSATLSGRYAPRWYVRSATIDAAGRTRLFTTGVTVPQLLGSDGLSQIEISYTKRGVVGPRDSKPAIGGSYGALFQGATYTVEGMVDTLTMGDAAATRRAFTYDENRRIQTVTTFRAAAPQWSSPPPGSSYVPPAPGTQTTQLELEHYKFEHDEVGNLTKIIDYRADLDWPGVAKPTTREFTYDDLYRLTQVTYTRAAGGAPDGWTSPYTTEMGDATRPQPSPHVSFANRVQWQKFVYDWLGTLQQTTDNESGFWDRSLGNTTTGSATSGPEQVRTASNRSIAPSSTRKGDLSVAVDGAGNYTDLVVRRDGPCLPSPTASCWQRFKYEWNEVGELTHAQRWDLSAAERTANGPINAAPPARAANADLRYAYGAMGGRTVKTAVAGTQTRYTVYVFDTLELRSTTYDTTASPLDYDQNAATTELRIPSGLGTARVVYTPQNLPSMSSGHQHVFLEMADQIGSNTFAIDQATGELVEFATYQAYGAPDSDYRPGRWGNVREPYRFSGKEEDIEVGLSYFGARYYSPYLGMWTSPDPATIHAFKSDANPYAYVHGSPAMITDSDGQIIPLIVVGIIVGAALGAGSSFVAQASAVNWHLGSLKAGNFLNMFLASVAGAVGGAVSGGLTTLIGQAATNALGSVGGAIATGAAAGEAGNLASYLTSCALPTHTALTLKGFAMGGVEGFVGGMVGAGTSAVLGGGAWAGLAGAATGSGSHFTALKLGGEKSTFGSFLMSLGTGLAGAAASAELSHSSADTVQHQLRDPSNMEVAQAKAQIEGLLSNGYDQDKYNEAARIAADLWGIPRSIPVVNDPNMTEHYASTNVHVSNNGKLTMDIGIATNTFNDAGEMMSVVLHESVHVGQNLAHDGGLPNTESHEINELEARQAELNNSARLGLSSSYISNPIQSSWDSHFDELSHASRDRVNAGDYGILPGEAIPFRN